MRSADFPIRLLGVEQSGARITEPASLALVALNELNRAVGVIGRDGDTIISNPAFDRIFDGEARIELRTLVGSADELPERTGPHQVPLQDGRTLCIETATLPEGILVTAEDISEQLAEKERANEEARIDSLTGLGNRLMFCERLRELLTNLDPAVDTAAVLSFDLDRFKAINDSLGHPTGDALLRVVADRLRSSLKRGDVAARVGGDEFAIIQIGQPQPQSAAALAKRLVDLLSRSYIVDGHLINIGASVGIVMVPSDGTDYDRLIKNADLALYRAKRGGRGTYRFFETAMDEQMQARRSLEIEFRRALALHQFALVYQPQFNLGSKKITGFEALLRWHNPKRGLVSPAEFIPLAEEIGLIVPVGEWVVRTACREAASWAQPLNIAVNISAVQFGSPNLVTTILSALAESGLDPHRLELEITESVLLGDKALALDVLHKVRAIGVRVSMDDFGTGYSSLSYLRSFPFDKIKINQSFVRGTADDPSGMAIVRAIAALGQSLGMTTTAEGVETDEQMARIAADGCTDVQGYLISKPLQPEKIGEFLSAQAPASSAFVSPSAA